MPCLERCPNCPTRHNPELKKNVVPGDGPTNARVVVVLEGPGRQENNFKRPAVGKTGDETNNIYLPLAGLDRQSVYVTNTFKCHWADGGDTPPESVIKSCADFHLRRELEEINPEIVVLAGGVAGSLVPLSIEMEHGIPRMGRLWGWEGVIFPSFHPALGIHMPERMQNLLDDWKFFKSVVRGRFKVPTDRFPQPDYYLLRSASEVRWALGDDRSLTTAVDTESRKEWRGYRSTMRYRPYCATFANDPNTGYMVKVSDREAWGEFGHQITRFKRVIMHNSPHDWSTLAEAGIELDWKLIEDTMSLAYIDGRLAKGLKSLAYRLLGMRMRSFDDVVVPYGVKAALDYIYEAMLHEWPEPVQEWTGEMVEKKCPDCKGTSVLTVGRGKKAAYYRCDCDNGYVVERKMTRKQGVGQKISRLVTDYIKDPESIDLWERWMGWGDAIDPLVTKLGPLPLPSIEMVPENEAMIYACGDAVGTLRIYPILKQRLVKLRRENV